MFGGIPGRQEDKWKKRGEGGEHGMDIQRSGWNNGTSIHLHGRRLRMIYQENGIIPL